MEPARLHNRRDVGTLILEHPEILQRITVQDQQIRMRSRLQRAQPAFLQSFESASLRYLGRRNCLPLVLLLRDGPGPGPG